MTLTERIEELERKMDHALESGLMTEHEILKSIEYQQWSDLSDLQKDGK